MILKMGGRKSKDEGSGLQKGSRYVPSFIPPPMASKDKEYENRKEERTKCKEKGKSRNIDHFMEELRQEQEMRERRNQEHENSRDPHQSDSFAVIRKQVQDGSKPLKSFASMEISSCRVIHFGMAK